MHSHRLTFPCAFHPPQLISQFCQHKQCMLPLCKQCLPIHNKEHSTMTAPPNIIDIAQLLERINNDIHSQTEMLHKKSAVLGKLQKNAEQVHKITLKKLEGDRTDTIRLVNSKFDEMSKTLLAGYEERIIYIRHMQDKIETLERALEALNGTLYKNKPMRTIIMWQSQELENLGLEFQVKLEKELLAPYKVQLLNVESSRLSEALNSLTSDRLIQSNFSFQPQFSNPYFQTLSKVLETEIDLKPPPKRKSSRIQKNHSEEKERTPADVRSRKIAEVLGSMENAGERKWANRTGKLFQMKQNFD